MIKRLSFGLGLFSLVFAAHAQSYEELYGRASGKFNSGDYAGAEADFSRVIDIRTSVQSLYYRGYARYRQGNVAGAKRDFDLALLIDPDDPMGREGRAGIRLLDGDVEGAIGDLDVAVRRSHPWVELWLQRAAVHRRMQNFTGALADEDKAFELKSPWAPTHSSRAMTKACMGDYEGAVTEITKAIKNDTGVGNLLLRAGFWQQLHDSEAALADIEEALRRDPKISWAYRRRAMVHQERGNLAEALIDLRRAVDLAARPAETYYLRMMIWIVRARLGERSTATSEFQAWFEEGYKGDASPWTLQLLRFFADRIKEDELFAAAEIGQSVVVRKQRGEAWYYAGMKRLVAGDTTKAKDYLEKCRASGITYFFEHDLASVELTALEKRQR